MRQFPNMSGTAGQNTSSPKVRRYAIPVEHHKTPGIPCLSSPRKLIGSDSDLAADFSNALKVVGVGQGEVFTRYIAHCWCGWMLVAAKSDSHSITINNHNAHASLLWYLELKPS